MIWWETKEDHRAEVFEEEAAKSGRTLMNKTPQWYWEAASNLGGAEASPPINVRNITK